MYSPKDYWASLADVLGGNDTSGLAPVLHPHTPEWFNNAIDRLQDHAVRRAIASASIRAGARFLDVGCGTGRWVRRYSELAFVPVGVDQTLGMLRIARALHTRAPLMVGTAHCLPFADAAFDAVSDITVVQHIPYERQPVALREMVRVLRIGGRLILLELIRGRGSHIFPRPAGDWIREVQSCGTVLVDCFGQEYFLPDRLFVSLVQMISGRVRSLGDMPLAGHPVSANDHLMRRLYWWLRWISVGLSVLTEPVAATIFPISTATHAILVFRKTS